MRSRNTFRNTSATNEVGISQMGKFGQKIGCDRKMNERIIKPYHSCTNPENLKIGLGSRFWDYLSHKLTTKKILK